MTLLSAPEPGLRIDLEDIPVLREAWRVSGRKVVLTNGCFDILHAGHVDCLTAARALGDVLVVAINDDDSVRALKGSGRPIFPLDERIQLLCSLRSVDVAVPFSSPTAEEVVRVVVPDVYVKGGDYDPDVRRPPEADTAAGLGAAVVFVPAFSHRSTSGVLRQIRAGAG
jgi:D-beta-D-heptose 7-phosphate kinase/D-beta-D-heptose 1-phosphate adenosyltransferase